MERFLLQDEFRDAAAERGLIAAVSQNPSLLRELDLPDGIFTDDVQMWGKIAEAVQRNENPPLPPDYKAVSDPRATAQHLRNLLQRRLIAGALEKIA